MALLVSFIRNIVITTRIQWETELYFVYLTFIRQWDISDDHALGLKMGHKLNSKQTRDDVNCTKPKFCVTSYLALLIRSSQVSWF